MEDAVFEDVETPRVAVVPVTQTVYEAPKLARTRPNANYVAQLIATAEQLPQTRNLRRAEPADALSAYSARQRELQRESVATIPAHLEKAA
ncbi:MAG: hypothetical protein JO141_04680 [Bradyrhizobium sp.]|nr:hypothetical protein [Bradyrhizobium sp.]